MTFHINVGAVTVLVFGGLVGGPSAVAQPAEIRPEKNVCPLAQWPHTPMPLYNNPRLNQLLNNALRLWSPKAGNAPIDPQASLWHYGGCDRVNFSELITHVEKLLPTACALHPIYMDRAWPDACTSVYDFKKQIAFWLYEEAAERADRASTDPKRHDDQSAIIENKRLSELEQVVADPASFD